MKILAVGMNYPMHIKELEGNKPADSSFIDKEDDPVIFTKQDSSIIQPGKPFFVPDFAERFDYETEIVVKISRIAKDVSERFAHRYYDKVTVGIDFTARDLQEKLRAKGLPWDICKGFDGAAALGSWVDKAELGDVQDLHFHLDKNGETVQQGHTADMIYSVDRIIAYCSRFFTLKTGDLIYTGTPVGVGPVQEGDKLEAYIGDRRLLELKIK